MADDTSTDGTTTTTDDGAATATDATSTERPELGEAGKKALQEERRKARDAQKQLNEATSRLKEYEDRDKSEAEKAAERLAAAERERDQAKAAELRLRVAAKHGISDEHADLFLTGADEATLTKQAEKLAQLAEGGKRKGNHVPREGTNTKPAASDERQFVKELFGSGG